MLLMLAVLSSGCTLLQGAGKEADRASETDSETLRVLISSDIHYTDQVNCYGIDMEKRMQHWVDSVLAEHAEAPFDLIVLNGDLSLDYGSPDESVLDTGVSTTKIFIDNYLSQLPEDLPVFVMPGNHELYSDEEWYELVGNHRQGHMVVEDTLFLFMDNYREGLNPEIDHGGIYTSTDVEYINEMMSTYPEYDTYIIAHYIDPKAETQNFRNVIVENEHIKGMFSGHTHDSEVLELGEYWGNMTIAQTGHFSYYFSSSAQKEKAFWGFRELIVTPEGAYSQYITVKGDAIISGEEKHFERMTGDLVRYE